MKRIGMFLIAAALSAVFSGCGGGGGGGGSAPPSNCVSHSYKACYNNDVYWHNSCDVRETISQDCSASQTCSSAQCVSTIYTWNKTFGGAQSDTAIEIAATPDGGYVFVGDTRSSSAGETDMYVVKVGLDGQQAWAKTFGGASFDSASSLAVLSDGSIAVAGRTSSSSVGGSDMWLMKLTSSGAQSWQNKFGLESAESGEAIRATTDGGFIAAGYAFSKGAGDSDMWLVKTNSGGAKSWDVTGGGTGHEVAWDLRLATEGGYIVAGYTQPAGSSNSDLRLARITTLGAKSWEKDYGGSMKEQAFSVTQTSDGGFAAAGYTESTGAGAWDAWVIKTDFAGDLVWGSLYGGTGYDAAGGIVQTSDGGYAVTGYVTSTANKEDMFLMKLTSTGAREWVRIFGGADRDYGNSLIQTADGGYAVVGSTKSTGSGEEDAWVVKTDSSGVVR